MDIAEFQKHFERHDAVKRISEWLESRQKNLFIKGLIGSAPAVFLHNAGIGAGRSIVFILHDEEEAGYDKEEYDENAGAWVDAYMDGDTLYYTPSGVRLVKQILIKFTDEACAMLVNVPRIFLPTALRGCVAWARENNVELITEEHMKIINDKRAQEKKKK